MTKLQFSVIMTFGLISTLGFLAAHTADPGAWTLPIVIITGGSLYASRSLFDQANKRLKKLRIWAKHSGLDQSSPKLLYPSNRKRR